MNRFCLGLVLALVVGGGGVRAQTPLVDDKPPPLSELDKLRVLNAAKDVRLFELQIEQLSQALEKAREALSKLVKEVTPPGFVLSDKLEPVRPTPPQASSPPPSPPDSKP